MDRKDRIHSIFKALFNRYGSQYWWPGDGALECIIGAILTQNTSWNNVEKAINGLKNRHLLSIDEMINITTEELAELIKPSGYYNQKAKKIKDFVALICSNYSGNLDRLLEEDLHTLRSSLLNIKGIGPETADSIILYAANKPIFVVDAYTHRIFYRHNMITEDTDYQSLQDLFMDSLPDDTNMFNEYHALIVKVGKEHCKKKNPICEGCPLESDPHTV